MIETSEQLAQHIRQNLPPSNAITGLKVFETQGFVSFRWYERDFVVKRSLEVFEVKNQNLFATGASMLMQSVLTDAQKDGKVVATLVGSIRQAEDLIADEQQRDSGFKLLKSVGTTLKKLGGSTGLKHPHNPVTVSRSSTNDIAA